MNETNTEISTAAMAISHSKNLTLPRAREREMEIDITETEYCKQTVKYQASTEAVKEKKDFVAREMAKTYEVKGFRKGKASPEVIRLSYPRELEAHLKQEMLNKAFSDTVTEKNIKPFGGPQIISSTIEGNNFDCEFSVHTLPEFELKEYKGFDIPKHNTGTSIEELSQQILQELRTEHATSTPYEEADFVQLTDSIVVQYDSFLKDDPVETRQPIAKLSSEGTILEVGRINVKGFDDALLGMKPGEEREFSLTTPDKDFDPEYLSKELTFKVKLIGGSKKTPAGLDDQLAQKIGLENFAALETQVTGVAGAKIQGMENGHYQDQIGRRLIANHDFKIPDWISIPEAKVQAQMAKKVWDDLTEEERAKQIKEAEDGIKLSLVLGKIQDEEPEAQLTDEEMLEMGRKNIGQYTQDADKVMQDIYAKGQMSMFLSRIKDENTLNFILRNCNIIE
jgi:trigger factor